MASHRRKIKRFIILLILSAIAFGTLYPAYFMAVNSFKGEQEYVLNKLGLPQHWNLATLTKAWSRVGHLFANSVRVVVPSVILSLFICSMAGYAFSHIKFKYRDQIFLLVLSFMVVPFMSIIVPLFRLMCSMHLVNTRIGLTLLYAASCIPFGTYLMTSYFKKVPGELLEAAKIDGASLFQIYWRIMLPIGRPVLATLSILNFLWLWNELLFALLMLPDNTKRTIMVGIALEQGQYKISMTLVIACLLIASLPVIAIFLLLQRYLIKGMITGGVK